jgi:hypothetical protein
LCLEHFKPSLILHSSSFFVSSGYIKRLGFKDQIYDVFQILPPNIQVALFSATMPTEALEITEKFMNKPLKILVKQEEITLEGTSSLDILDTNSVYI